MTREAFIRLIDNGGDIMFDCGIHKYTVCSWRDRPIDIAEQDTCANRKLFSSAKELVDQYMVDGKSLAERIDQIKITDIA